MNLRKNSIQNHTNTVADKELQESPKIGLEKLELDELDLVSGARFVVREIQRTTIPPF
ncbi:MAG: hypothetical protein AAFQ91_31095 [Cyanobacteria bacterium J06621_15]